MFTTIKQGSKISGVFPKHFRHLRVVVLHNLCPWKASPKGTSETKRLEPWAFWHLWSPFSPKATQKPRTQETHPNKNLPTNHWRQATWHHSNHALLASVHAPRCASPGQWSWHLNPPEGHVPKRLVSCFRLGGWGPLAEPPDGPKEPTRRPGETGREKAWGSGSCSFVPFYQTSDLKGVEKIEVFWKYRKISLVCCWFPQLYECCLKKYKGNKVIPDSRTSSSSKKLFVVKIPA